MLLRSIILRVSSRPWFERFIKKSRLTRGVVKRFVAGDTLEEAIAVAETLRAEGFFVTLDLLGENTASDDQAEAACQEYASMLERISHSKYSGGSAPENINISIKLTQLGLSMDNAAVIRRLEALSDTAAASSNFIRVDMEDSSCTQATLDAVRQVSGRHNNVGVALQAMLLRSPADLETLMPERIRIRLVKGAYLEPAAVAHQDKSDVDGAFKALAGRMLEHAKYPAFGTHDKTIIEAITADAEKLAVDKQAFEFQLLFGIRRDLQKKLRDEGFNVRVYVPYGSAWYPYFSRRLAERPANLFFFLRSLFGK